jgi:hypothetical protein
MSNNANKESHPSSGGGFCTSTSQRNDMNDTRSLDELTELDWLKMRRSFLESTEMYNKLTISPGVAARQLSAD